MQKISKNAQYIFNSNESVLINWYETLPNICWLVSFKLKKYSSSSLIWFISSLRAYFLINSKFPNVLSHFSCPFWSHASKCKFFPLNLAFLHNVSQSAVELLMPDKRITLIWSESKLSHFVYFTFFCSRRLEC